MMQSDVITFEQYIKQIPIERTTSIAKLRQTIISNLPEGFQEITYRDMISYVVPHELYASGYHCNPNLPLPFINIASQKNFIALYHMGLYAMPELHDWFIKAYPVHSKLKLDMGKSCIRFKKPDQIPFELIGLLMGKISMDKWIEVYENIIRR